MLNVAGAAGYIDGYNERRNDRMSILKNLRKDNTTQQQDSAPVQSTENVQQDPAQSQKQQPRTAQPGDEDYENVHTTSTPQTNPSVAQDTQDDKIPIILTVCSDGQMLDFEMSSEEDLKKALNELDTAKISKGRPVAYVGAFRFSSDKISFYGVK